MNKEIKFQILWKKHNRDFTTEIAEHYTTLDRLMDKKDKFPYQYVEIIAKRQFTGLVDKNGKEIYEGDIVNDKFDCGQIKEIRWNEKTACFCYYCDKLDFSWDGLSDSVTHGEVIGNIHENPELLDNAK